MSEQTRAGFDEDFLPIILLFVALLIMSAGFIVTELFFIYCLNIHNKFYISGYWIFSIFPALLYFSHLQKKGKIFFKDIGLSLYNIRKSILFGILTGIVAGIIGWTFSYSIGSPVSPLPKESISRLLFVSVFSAPIKEEEV